MVIACTSATYGTALTQCYKSLGNLAQSWGNNVYQPPPQRVFPRMFKQSLCLLLIASSAVFAVQASHFPPDSGQRSEADELTRKRQREQLRSTMQQPDADADGAGKGPVRKQLSAEERNELRRQIERQHHQSVYPTPAPSQQRGRPAQREER